jgi:hypothetical protein
LGLDTWITGEELEDKRAGGVTQAIEPLPSKCEVLSSNSSTTKKKVKD